jgi:hypothetical protein
MSMATASLSCSRVTSSSSAIETVYGVVLRSSPVHRSQQFLAGSATSARKTGREELLLYERERRSQTEQGVRGHDASWDDRGDEREAVAGEVAGVSHFGDTLQYVVRTHTRDVIVLLPRQKAPNLHPGDPVWAHWSAHDVYQFSAAQESLVLAEPASEVAI